MSGQTRHQVGRLGLALCLVALSLVGPAPEVRAAIPNRSLSFVAVPVSEAPWALQTARLVAQHAESRLGLNPQKVHLVEKVPGVQAFEDLFRRGAPFQYVSQGDLVVVYLAGASRGKKGLKLGKEEISWKALAKIQDYLKAGPGEDLGFFDGTVLLVLDRLEGGKLDVSLRPDTVLLDLSAAKAKPVDPSVALEGVDEPLVVAGRGALATLQPPSGTTVSPGAIAWVGAIERMLVDTSLDGSATSLTETLEKAKKASGVRAKLKRGSAYTTSRFRLFSHTLRVVLNPWLQNVETDQLLDRLQQELEAATPEALKSMVVIEKRSEEDPSADITCHALATAAMADLECVEGRAPIFGDTINVTNAAEALAPVVRQVLRNYKALAATDWAGRRKRGEGLDVVVLVDSSLSMAYHDPTIETDPELGEAPSKREVLLTRLASSLGSFAAKTGKKARLSVFVFGETVRALRLPGGKGESVEIGGRLDAGKLAAYAAVLRGSLKAQRFTGISAALTEAARTLAGGDADAARHVVLLTDGRETLQTIRPEASVRRAARALHQVGATLSSVGLSEQKGRLPSYLERMRAGKEVLKRYVKLVDLSFLPRKWQYCRRSERWDEEQAEDCGELFAKLIEEEGAYQPRLLDAIRRAEQDSTLTGVFLQADTVHDFQRRLQELLTRITGGGIYLSDGSERLPDAGDGRVRDRWTMNLELETTARVVLYNRDGLLGLKWSVTRDGGSVGISDGLSIDPESDAVTVLTLPAPARGVWVIEREGQRP